uniref:Phosphoprotein n=1 Tax=Paramyxoviridae sp. TaxID=1663356 RepID=A0A858HW88_9MONO|nr:phosphoprotein [Paramyxoviridae sp.]
METNCQRDIKNALQVLAVVKETQSPKSEEELRERLDISGVTTTSSSDSGTPKSEDRSEAQSRPSGGGEEQQSSTPGISIGFTEHIEGDGNGVSTGGSDGTVSAGVFYTTVCENNPDEGVRGSSCYVMLGKAGGIEPVPDSAGDREPSGSNPVGEDDDAGQSGVTVTENNQPTITTGDPVVKPKRRLKNIPEQETAVDENMKEEDIKEAFGMATQPRPRRLTGLETAASSLPSIIVHKDQTKRGIDENTTSSGQMQDSELKHGATRSAQGLEVYRGGRNADAASVQKSARSVHLITNNPKTSHIVGISDGLGNNKRWYQSSEASIISSIEGSCRGSLADGDSSVVSDSPLVIMSEILENQKWIMDKLKSLDEIKHDVESIKKTIMKHSLSLSTLEGQLSSVMIAVPSTGSQPRQVDVNQDLRPLLGRDKGRGIPEMGKMRAQTVSFDEPGQSKTTKPQIPKIKIELDKKILPPAIDSGRTNATGYKPAPTLISREVIIALIDSRIKDKEMNTKMKRLLGTAKTQRELIEIHKAIINALKN